MSSLIDSLQKVDIFSSLSRNELAKIVQAIQIVDYPAKAVIFEEGDAGEELYIVRSGEIVVAGRLKNGKERIIDKLGVGTFLGEMSILENEPRSATCYAGVDSTLLKLSAKDYFKFTSSNPEIGIKISHKMLMIITGRLKGISDFHSDMIRWGEDARKRAITDELTGVYNRTFLDEALENYFLEARRTSKEMSLLMVDLDHFRKINDAYGNAVGDKAIIAIVRTFQKYLGKKDIIARYGGDEFTVIMPDRPLGEAKLLAEKICEKINKLTFFKAYKGPVKNLSTSIGAASSPRSAKSVEKLKKQADAALYRAKEEGRNRVITA